MCSSARFNCILPSPRFSETAAVVCLIFRINVASSSTRELDKDISEFLMSRLAVSLLIDSLQDNRGDHQLVLQLVPLLQNLYRGKGEGFGVKVRRQEQGLLAAAQYCWSCIGCLS